MISGKGDAGPVAKAIKAFSTETKGVLSAKGGYFDGEALDAQQVVAIADLPGKDALRAQLLGLLVAVPTGLVRVLNAKASSIVNVMLQVRWLRQASAKSSHTASWQFCQRFW